MSILGYKNVYKILLLISSIFFFSSAGGFKGVLPLDVLNKTQFGGRYELGYYYIPDSNYYIDNF